MSALVSLLMLLAAGGPDLAQYEQRDPGLSTACRTYSRSVGTLRYGDLLDVLSAAAQDGPLANATPCALGRYVVAECKSAPDRTIGQALAALSSKAARGGAMPAIGRCGA